MNENSLLTQDREYRRFNLTQNPFSYSPVPKEDPQVFTGQEQVKSAIGNVLGTAISTGKSNHLVVTGKYGNGKSHSLKYAKGLLQTESDSIIGYVAQPGDSFLDIYHEFMYDLGYESFQNLSHEYLARVVNTQEIEVGRKIESGHDMKQAIDDGDVLLSDVIPVATRELKSISKFTDFSRALVHLVYEDTSLYAWQWLSGEGLRYEQRKKMEIHTDIDDDSKAVKAFTSLKKLFQHLDYGILCLLIDEFESIAGLKPKRKQSVLNSLRHVMDMNPRGVSIVIGCAPEVWQDVMSEYHAFSERIGREVGLRPLDQEQTEALIEEYLAAQAIENQEPVNPFTDEAIEVAVKRSQGNIRRTISLCSRALDEAIDRGEDRVTAATVEEVLQ
jgi:type II secretory pathway predicted ATPase ExeA